MPLTAEPGTEWRGDPGEEIAGEGEFFLQTQKDGLRSVETPFPEEEINSCGLEFFRHSHVSSFVSRVALASRGVV
jgi:hypothetical protein